MEILEDRRLMTFRHAATDRQRDRSRPCKGPRFPCSPPAAPPTPQTYTVTSSNPNIVASIAQGPFWTLGVSYTDPTNSANDFTGTLTYQLFSNLTPNTVN